MACLVALTRVRRDPPSEVVIFQVDFEIRILAAAAAGCRRGLVKAPDHKGGAPQRQAAGPVGRGLLTGCGCVSKARLCFDCETLGFPDRYQSFTRLTQNDKQPHWISIT